MNKKLIALSLAASLAVPFAVYSPVSAASIDSDYIKALDSINFKDMTDAQRQEKLMELAAKLVEANADIQADRAKLAAAKDAFEAAKAQLNEESAKLKVLEEKFNAAKEALNAAEAKAKEIALTLEKLNKEYSTKKAAIEDAEKNTIHDAEMKHQQLIADLDSKAQKLNADLTQAKKELEAASGAKEEVKAAAKAKVEKLEAELKSFIDNGEAKVEASEKKLKETKAIAKRTKENDLRDLEFKYYSNDNYGEKGLLAAATEAAAQNAKDIEEAKKVYADLEAKVKAQTAVVEELKGVVKVKELEFLSAQNELATSNYNKLVIMKKVIELSAKGQLTTAIDQLKLSKEEKEALKEAGHENVESLNKQIEDAEKNKKAAEEALKTAQNNPEVKPEETATTEAGKKPEKETEKEAGKEAKKESGKEAGKNSKMVKTGIAAGSMLLLAVSGLGTIAVRRKRK